MQSQKVIQDRGSRSTGANDDDWLSYLHSCLPHFMIVIPEIDLLVRPDLMYHCRIVNPGPSLSLIR